MRKPRTSVALLRVLRISSVALSVPMAAHGSPSKVTKESAIAVLLLLRLLPIRRLRVGLTLARIAGRWSRLQTYDAKSSIVCLDLTLPGHTFSARRTEAQSLRAECATVRERTIATSAESLTL